MRLCKNENYNIFIIIMPWVAPRHLMIQGDLIESFSTNCIQIN